MLETVIFFIRTNVVLPPYSYFNRKSLINVTFTTLLVLPLGIEFWNDIKAERLRETYWFQVINKNRSL